MIDSAIPLPAWFGKGFANPLRLDDTGTRIAFSSGEQRIFDSMLDIILTDITERPHLRRNGVPYGTRIRGALWSPPDVVKGIIRFEAERALTLWEPRIIVDSVMAEEVQRENGSSAIIGDVQFRFRSTNRPDNLVVPFTLKGKKP